MSSTRFELILKFLHLNDYDQQPQRGQPGHDKLYKTCPLLDVLLKNLKEMYTPTQYLSIDESMISFKGKLAFLQYMPEAVATGLLEGLSHPRSQYTASTPELPIRLTKRAFPERIPDNSRVDCKVCSDRVAKKRHQTSFRCKLCHTPLCLYPCLECCHAVKHQL